MRGRPPLPAYVMIGAGARAGRPADGSGRRREDSLLKRREEGDITECRGRSLDLIDAVEVTAGGPRRRSSRTIGCRSPARPTPPPGSSPWSSSPRGLDRGGPRADAGQGRESSRPRFQPRHTRGASWSSPGRRNRRPRRGAPGQLVRDVDSRTVVAGHGRRRCRALATSNPRARSTSPHGRSTPPEEGAMQGVGEGRDREIVRRVLCHLIQLPIEQLDVPALEQASILDLPKLLGRQSHSTGRLRQDRTHEIGLGGFGAESTLHRLGSLEPCSRHFTRDPRRSHLASHQVGAPDEPISGFYR